MARSGLVFAGLALVSALTLTGGAQAQTVSYADAMTELAQACGADIHKHCHGVNLGNNAIQQCLAKHQSSVSQQCTSTLEAVTASIARRLEAQASVFKVCASHAATLCKGVHGEANILHCLIKTERIDGQECNQAITDAGWR